MYVPNMNVFNFDLNYDVIHEPEANNVRSRSKKIDSDIKRRLN